MNLVDVVERLSDLAGELLLYSGISSHVKEHGGDNSRGGIGSRNYEQTRFRSKLSSGISRSTRQRIFGIKKMMEHVLSHIYGIYTLFCSLLFHGNS